MRNRKPRLPGKVETRSLEHFKRHPDRMPAGDCWIWSAEHGAYWRSGRAGYTNHREAAGVYAMAEAFDATRHCDPDKRIWFVFATPQPGREPGE